MDLYKSLTEAFKNLIVRVTTGIPEDLYSYIKKAHEEEENPIARAQFEALLKDMEIACMSRRPICQDTGTPYLFLEVGDDFPLKSKIVDAFKDAIRYVTKEMGILRPNAVDPVYAKNSGDNTGRFVPWVHIDLVPGNELNVKLMFKGGGSEAPSTLVMSPPLKGWEKLKETIVSTVAEAGPLPCPPVIVGVAVAAGADMALSLAKRSLLRPIGERHPDPKVARMEEELLEALNRLEIGPHGFGGKFSVLDVKFEYAHRHPATFAIGIVTSCWATRRGSMIVKPDGSYIITSRHLVPEGGSCVVR